jgi:tetratricopeptide (TPR) repeat protein
VPRREAAGAAVRRVLSEAPGLPAQAAALAALLYLAATDGGYYAQDWYPAGLLVLALVAVWAAVLPPARVARRALAAWLLLVVFAAWALLSIVWAGEPSAAWDGGNRGLFYAALFGLFGMWPLPPREARWLVTIAALGVAAIGAVELLRWAAAADPRAFMLGGRFSEPVGYQNGNVALWLMGAFGCLWLASGREVAPVVRGLALGAVPMLAVLALMGQSRGSLFALPVALLGFLVLAPERLRLLAALVPAALAVAYAAGPALDVVDAEGQAALAGLVDDAARAILLPSALLAALGAVAGLAERRWTPSRETARRISSAATGVVAVLALAAVAVAATQAGEIRAELSDRWDEFKSNESAASGSARLGSGGTNRYDFWTVAWEGFEREPLRGVGMDNFQQDYMLRGESREKPRFPHSLELGVLSGTGLVGALLLLAALAAAVTAALRSRRRAAVAGPVAAALGVFGYWLLHASVDWLYELPALGGIAFAMLGLATAVRDDAGRESGAARARTLRTPQAARIAAPLLAGAAAVSFALPWLAERDIDRAADSWRVAPEAAYERLDRAGRLNPLSAQPGLFEAAIAIQLDDLQRAEDAYLEVLDREPRNAHAWLQLAAVASTRQDDALARRRVAKAVQLAPRDEATLNTRDRIADGAKVTPQQVNRAVLKYAR